MHYKKHEVRKYEVPTRLFTLRGPSRNAAAIVTFSGARAKSAPPASTSTRTQAPKE